MSHCDIGGVERDVHRASRARRARTASNDAAWEIAAFLDGIDDPEEVNLACRDREHVAASPAGRADRDSRANEVGQDVGEKARRDAHPLGEAPRTHGATVIEDREGERRPNGVVASAGQFDPHGAMLPRRPMASVGPNGPPSKAAIARRLRLAAPQSGTARPFGACFGYGPVGE